MIAGAEASKTPILDQIMAEYNAASEDAIWEGDHPILKMAVEIDSLNAKVAAYAGLLYDALKFIEAGHGDAKGRALHEKIRQAIVEGKI